jgi:4-hydroxy-3-polyprenylbenzoate decarboxylase
VSGARLDNLSDFIAAIDGAGELVRITQPVSVIREITEIADRCMKSPGGGPALLFEKPVLADGRQSSTPVAINLFGSDRRMALSLNVGHLDEIGSRITELLRVKVPDGWREKLALIPKLLELGKYPPRSGTSGAPCQQVIHKGPDVDVRNLPVITCWPEDGGPYITLPQVITRDPVTGVRNVGMYRVQVLGKDLLAMHWQRHKVGAAHWREMASRGERMPVAIALGGDPASIYSASAPLPPNIDEYVFAGFLRRKPVSLARAVSVDLDVPAEAEIVIEGYIDPAEALVLEGPFGDHTGFYRSRTTTRRYTSPRLLRGVRRSIPRSSLVGRRWKTITWVTQPSAFFYRSFGSRCRKSLITTCRLPGYSTTSSSSV